jgi:intracellular septation protein
MPNEPSPAPVSLAYSPENPGLKLAIELGPLLAFFLAYAAFGIKAATGVLMAATLAALVSAPRVLGRITPVLLMTAVLTLLTGLLTFALDDPRFIKVKPTAVNLLFAAILAFGLATGRPLLKLLFGEALTLTEAGWRALTQRWIAFFLAMALLNEFIWRNFSETFWVNFKVFGILPLTVLFTLAQLRLIARHTPNAHNAEQRTES